ncbi:HAMP domain-containing sensor histidine kinase [Bifidobacterium sp. UBA4282]|uniref:sensor histidine kinase n=1 Tax=Bifidobacterium sp. UBA4282 TaxID=1946096 RepID=UPI0025C1818C|nr:hypothetical protein [Bifidobacterium sp. UBA4282]
MRTLLDQLFAYARANDPDCRPEIETIAVHPLLAEILLGHYLEFEERGWEPAVSFGDESLTVDADRAAMGRIIENLVSNTLRYGAAAPSIVQERSRMTFSNAVDTATADGLDLDRMFHRFYQADGARSGNGRQFLVYKKPLLIGNGNHRRGGLTGSPGAMVAVLVMRPCQ